MPTCDSNRAYCIVPVCPREEAWNAEPAKCRALTTPGNCSSCVASRRLQTRRSHRLSVVEGVQVGRSPMEKLRRLHSSYQSLRRVRYRSNPLPATNSLSIRHHPSPAPCSRARSRLKYPSPSVTRHPAGLAGQWLNGSAAEPDQTSFARSTIMAVMPRTPTMVPGWIITMRSSARRRPGRLPVTSSASSVS